LKLQVGGRSVVVTVWKENRCVGADGAKLKASVLGQHVCTAANETAVVDTSGI
jgi:hypothetical protein